MDFKHTIDELKYLQALPLDLKIAKTKLRIIEFYEHYNGNVHISFSGGKDSTVLLHIARGIYPNIKAVFVDTGLEYPEIKAQIKRFENVETIRPKKIFSQVIKDNGYPVIGKKQARMICELQNPTEKNKKTRNLILTGKNQKGEPCESFKLANKWLYMVDAPFKVSSKCCDVMKKEPFHRYEMETGSKPIIATMACESKLRESGWLINGCNSFYTKAPKSKPMSFWTEQDVLQYIAEYNIPIPSVYGDVVKVGDKWTTTGENRTGCMFCMFGVHLEKYPNRFQRMAITHPKIYSYCMENLGIKNVLDYIGVDYKPKEKQPTLFEGGEEP